MTEEIKGQTKSKRVTSREIKKEAVDILGMVEDGSRPPRPGSCGIGESLFMVVQLLTVALIGLCCDYGEDNDGTGILPSTPQYQAGVYDVNKDFVQTKYAVFQDVHVMIFIGFGFLMTFIKTSSWSALAFNWIISAWALEWAILTTGFFEQLIAGKDLHKIHLNLTHLIIGDFGAGAAMITFGAILGKANLQQLFFLVWWEMIWYGLNEAICVGIFKVTDAGGSILVHTFGAYFGVAATYGFQPKRSGQSINMQSNYQSEMVAVVGSIFLWMFWPSFNGALSEGTMQHRIFVNTTLGIVGSVLSAACTSRILFGKLDMEIVLNATLAGGVAIGSSCDLICEPWAAIAVGMAGGILSSLGFAKIGPAICDSAIGLQDTCGVHSLHGMPGVFAAIVSMIYLTTLEGKGFPSDYLPVSKLDPPGDHTTQAVAQLKSLLLTLCISIISGLSGGFLCGLNLWKPVHALYRDDDHFHHVLAKYPKHYLEVSDEAVEYAKQAMLQIQKILPQLLPRNVTTNDDRLQWLGENLYNTIVRHEIELNKGEVLNFFNDVIELNKELIEESDIATESLIPGKIFDQIFEMLDDDGNGRLSRDEIIGYFVKLVEGKESVGEVGKAYEDNQEDLAINMEE